MRYEITLDDSRTVNTDNASEAEDVATAGWQEAVAGGTVTVFDMTTERVLWKNGTDTGLRATGWDSSYDCPMCGGSSLDCECGYLKGQEEGRY